MWSKHHFEAVKTRIQNLLNLPPTLTDPTLSCPGPLLKTTPPPPGYPWVSGVWYVTPEPRNRGLVLDHQLLKEPEPKTARKEPNLIKNSSFWVVL